MYCFKPVDSYNNLSCHQDISKRPSFDKNIGPRMTLLHAGTSVSKCISDGKYTLSPKIERHGRYMFRKIIDHIVPRYFTLVRL